MATERMPVDPNIGIPDLISRLGDDSKRLINDEVRLAKLEIRDHIKQASKDAMWLAISFGLAVVAMMGFTMFVITLVGRVLNGHMWIGAIGVGIIELGLGYLLIKRGTQAFKDESYSLAVTRESLKDTRVWVSTLRS
jgi:uncharacterized membrane protein YqjE